MKRFLDLALVIGTFPIWGVLILLLVILSYFKMGRPIFFLDERAGLEGKSFKLIKFRTMRLGEGSDAERLTAYGKLLRRTSIDEIPELINVLKGEMSLVGPRPLPIRYLPRYSKEQNRRHEVRPGITGLAQVNGRNALDWETKFRYDVDYVNNQSLFLDIKILVLTIGKVVMTKDIAHPGETTMSEFRG